MANNNNFGCCDCSRGHTVVPAVRLYELETDYNVALCLSCAAVSSQWKLTPDFKEWLERGGKTVNAWRKVPANACVDCSLRGKNTDKTDVFEGVPMCSGCKEHWELNRAYLSPFEWSHGWAAELEKLQNAVLHGTPVYVIIYKN